MAKFFAFVWHLFTGFPDNRMSELGREKRVLYFALKGTSKEDRSWMNEPRD